MERYIRVASINAEPMTMEEAFKNNLIEINAVTSKNCKFYRRLSCNL